MITETKERKGGRVGPYKCEMCGEVGLHSKDDTVCNKCDKELVASELVFLAEREARRPKRSCRDCGSVLKASRYFKCEKCLPNEDRETACPVWDTPETYADAETHVYPSAFRKGGKEPPRKEIKTGNKRCVKCGDTKDRTLFQLNYHVYGDSHSSYCKACHAKRHAKKAAQKEAA
jgi:hypothetical protein